MNAVLNDAARLVADFVTRSPTERLDLLSGLMLEGHARQINNANDDIELVIYGISACGKDSLDLIDNWVIMANRQDVCGLS